MACAPRAPVVDSTCKDAVERLRGVSSPRGFTDKKTFMPNIASVLKQEIARVARRETRSQIERLRKLSAQQRRGIAGLKRTIAALEREVASLSGSLRKSAVDGANGSTSKRARFSPKGIRSLRHRLGLSAENFARLIDVSSQSVYNWERKITRPREAQLKALNDLRGLGKRDAKTRLDALARKGAGKSRAASASTK